MFPFLYSYTPDWHSSGVAFYIMLR